jgi:imidazolonepropionase-like amidohydrolase
MPDSNFMTQRILYATSVMVALTSACSAGAQDGPAPAAPAAKSGVFSVTSPITILAGHLVDGRGGSSRNVLITVAGDDIVSVEPAGTNVKPTYDLSAYTVMPGGIDTHVHIDWHFDEDGHLHAPSTFDDAHEVFNHASRNANATLMSGITTVQSLGSVFDVALRDSINARRIAGPRVLTAVLQITQDAGSPAAIRQLVNRAADMHADVIKLFASPGLGGNEPNMTQAELDAGCAAAHARGLRAVVHAMNDESARRTALAGCNSVEHGLDISDSTLDIIAARGEFFDPNTWLVFNNYIANNSHFGLPATSIAELRTAIPRMLATFRKALQHKNVKIVFGTDAVAGAHGRNFDELIYRVEKGGQPPMQAIISATSLAAASLGMEKRIGAISAGMQADIIAVRGDPASNIEALRNVVFVMKTGVVYKKP